MATRPADHDHPAPLEQDTTLNPAETYERYMAPPLFLPAAEQLLDVVAPRPGDRVLDVGCGTGVVARRAALRVQPRGSVSGIDISPDMLAVARAAAHRDGVSIDWYEGRAEALPFPDASFDLVLSQFALMFFADRAKAMAEMRRVLRPGGRIGVVVMQEIERHPFYQSLDEAITRHLGISPVAAIFSLGGEREMRELFTGAGFPNPALTPMTIPSRFPNPAAFLAGEIDVDTAAIPAMQGLAPEARCALVAALEADMAPTLEAVTRGDEVLLPFQARIVAAAVPA